MINVFDLNHEVFIKFTEKSENINQIFKIIVKFETDSYTLKNLFYIVSMIYEEDQSLIIIFPKLIDFCMKYKKIHLNIELSLILDLIIECYVENHDDIDISKVKR